ncbi:hypothetical protein F0562_023634 [Nyssa sinensis]|uniref:Uncharacterized protein n=1 Tax=Nyssa sinensis TaxID=561372 RepID=A0A5J5BH24_9ASTE|nr:hypothetical protein F0562_023634 [Nyssa sinensis]
MAEGFEPYHVPQQSRRDKLRVLAHNHPGCVENLHGCAGLLPLYDPSLIPSDLLNCANLHHQNNPLSDTCKPNQNSACGVIKEKGVNLMGYVGGIINASSSSSTYLDPQSSIHINPGSIQEINSNPFLYTPQNLRIFDQSFNSGEVVDLVVFKPEAFSINHEANTNGQGLSLSLSSHHTHQNNLPLELNLQRYESSIFNDKVTSVGAGYIVPGLVEDWGGFGHATMGRDCCDNGYLNTHTYETQHLLYPVAKQSPEYEDQKHSNVKKSKV